jgi:hypothetical protein
MHLMESHVNRPQKVTLGGDKVFNKQDFIVEISVINVTPHAVLA